jgi:hypothetical protein
MKTLYANGDSWTQGDELGMPYVEHQTESFEMYWSWPWQLHKLLKTTVCINEGLKGTSNDRIFRRTTSFIRKYQKKYNTKDLTVAICWTTPDRWEIPVDVESNGEWEGWHIPVQQYGVNFPNFSHVSVIDDVAKQGLDNIHKPWVLTLPAIMARSLAHYNRMWQLKQICNSLNIKLIQTFALDWGEFDVTDENYNNEWHTDIQYLDKIFINYCRDNEYKLAPGGHPYKEGHEGWAKYIYDNI